MAFRIEGYEHVLREGVPFTIVSDGTPAGTRLTVDGQELVGVRGFRAEVSAGLGRRNRRGVTLAIHRVRLSPDE